MIVHARLLNRELACSTFLTFLTLSYRANLTFNFALRPCLDNSQSKATLEMNTDVNKFVVKPITNVVANPFTAGVPKENRKTHETTVVTWVSTRVAKALAKPAASAAVADLPAPNSSRMRSKMSTLLSTAMPMVSPR
jgi:hypothetical protein